MSVRISRMKLEDVQLAINWARDEGWNPGLADAGCFYSADNEGFFKAELNGELIAVGSAVVYDDDFAFCGLYIVAPQHRGNGYGMALTQARLAYCGGRNIGIDGVLENVEIYQNIGYQPYYENHRYQFQASPAPVAKQGMEVAIVPLAAVAFEALKAYDRQCFPAARDVFLKNWIQQPQSCALAYLEDGQLRGYVVRRLCSEGHKIGPLFADNAEIAEQLLNAAQQGIAGEVLILDVPEINSDAMAMVQGYGMEKIFATARMYQKGQPVLADDKIFGITSFELG